jgi:hypothetical protein
VPDHSTFEVGKRSHAFRAVNGLVGDKEVARLEFLSQGPNGAKGDDAADADFPQSGDVGAVIDFVRRKLVMEAMAGEESDIEGFLRGCIVLGLVL